MLIEPKANYQYETLEWLKWAVLQEVPGAFLAEVETAESFLRDTLLFRVKAEILGKRLPDRHYESSRIVDFYYPSTTWQTFKRTHSGSWWLSRFVKRWPVKNNRVSRTVRLSVDLQDYLMYPYQTVASPKLGQAVRVPVLSERLRTEGE